MEQPWYDNQYNWHENNNYKKDVNIMVDKNNKTIIIGIGWIMANIDNIHLFYVNDIQIWIKI